MNRLGARIFTIFALWALAIDPSPGHAKIYYYTDAEGHTVYTNDPDQVPPNVRRETMPTESRAGAPTVSPGKGRRSSAEALRAAIEKLQAERGPPSGVPIGLPPSTDLNALLQSLQAGGAPPAGADPQALVNQILGMSAKGGARGGVAAPPPAPSGSRASRLWKFLAPRIEWKSLLGSLAAYAALFWAWRLTKRHVPSTSMRMTVRVLLVMMLVSFSYVTYSRFLTRQINQVLGPGTGIQSMGDILGYVQRVKLQAEETRIVQEQMLLD